MYVHLPFLLIEANAERLFPSHREVNDLFRSLKDKHLEQNTVNENLADVVTQTRVNAAS